MLSIINIDVEFTFDGVMDKDASLNVYLIVFRLPVSFICNWYTVPTIWINMTKSLSATSDDSLSEDMWLYKNKGD